MSKRLLTLFLALTAMCASTMAQFITEENFPDANFRSFLIKNVDTNGDRWLSESETNAVTTLDVSNQGIKDLTGIEYFTKLKTLTCYGNEIKGANMSKLVNLLPFAGGRLYVCDGNVSPDNVITKAQVKKAGNKDWKVLKKEKYSSKWTSYEGEDLTVSARFFPDATFRSLVAAYDTDGDNILSATELNKVLEINVAGKGITDLTGIEHFTNLTRLYCNDNGLTSLYISDNQYLEMLDCSNNELTALDVSSNKHLYLLRCFGNNISGTAMSILISGLSLSLAEIGEWGRLVVCCDQSAHDNTITTAEIKDAMSRDWEVWQEEEGGLRFTAMLVKIDDLNFPDANFRAIVAGEGIDTDRDSYLSIDERKAVGKLNVSEKSIKNLSGVEYFTELWYLDCSENNLTKLNVGTNRKLTLLWCGNNSLSTLDVSKNTALWRLYCSGNSLKSLDVSKNTALTELCCNNNSLESLDVSNNTKLKALACFCNQIKGAAMDKLVNSLPDTGGTMEVCVWGAKTDNVITASQVRVATGKGWRVRRLEGISFLDYAGVFEPVAIDATNFPDEKFRNYLLAQDYGKDAVLTEDEMLAVTELNVGGMVIKNLKGIEHFTALTSLICSLNSLKSLDVSNNKALTKLYCNDNSLESLDVSKNTALTSLICSLNGLKSLDVSKNTALTKLYCTYNSLESLDVSKNTALAELNCNANFLTSLDVSKNTALTSLICPGNQIRGAAMTSLVNSLRSLPSGTEGLFYVCKDGAETDNIITTAQVSIAKGKGWTVKKWDIDGKAVDYAGEEPGIAIDATNFPDENFRSYLLAQDYGKDAVLTEDEMLAVTELDVRNKGIKDLKGIGHFTALTKLYCQVNSLKSLDVSKNTKLTNLQCAGNSLESLDVSKNVALTELNCSSNNLESLDVSACRLLTYLYCDWNYLKSMDVSKNTALTKLDCERNSLESLDVSKNTALMVLDCSSNSLTSLDVSKNTKLTSLDCSWNSLKSLDVSMNTVLTSLSCSGNQISGTAMTKLVNSLPETKDGYFVVKDFDSPMDNIITPSQVGIATSKGWKVYKTAFPELFNYAGLGDLNGDGYINEDDLDMIVKTIMGQKPTNWEFWDWFSDEDYQIICDLNNDGKVDAADIVVMNNILNEKK